MMTMERLLLGEDWPTFYKFWSVFSKDAPLDILMLYFVLRRLTTCLSSLPATLGASTWDQTDLSTLIRLLGTP